MRRALTAFDVTCIGVNAIVGSGIYLFPGKLGAALGPASIVAWVLTGALCLPLALTFATLGAIEERTGGPVRYTELAFGSSAAFIVGWTAWVTAVLSWAAVASALPHYLGPFVPALSRGAPAHVVTAAVVLGLGALNVFGVKPGARVAVALTIGKLIPLVLFVGLGLFAVRRAEFHPFVPHGVTALPAMALMTMFAYQGFEVVGVPAGEVESPRRAVPRAVVASILLSGVLYALVQVVFVGVGGRATSAPLPDAAQGFLGPSGAVLLGVGGLVSMLGFNAGTALSTPRYLQALAEDRLMPPVLARAHPRFETPAAAIAVSTLATLALTLVLDFGNLVDLSVLAVLGQYFATSAALIRVGVGVRKKLLGAVSLVISIAFGVECEARQFVVLGALSAVGVVVAVATRLSVRRAGS